MQLQMFQTFCDLVDTSSFSRAAEMNSITQSAVSQQIRSLENRYKAVLIERGRKNLSLTPEGQILHRAAREILRIHGTIEDQIREMQNIVAGKLRIATVYSIGLHELPPYLKMYREAHPDVEISVEYRRSTQVYAEVLDGTADFGLVAFPKQRKGVVVDETWQDELVLICPPKHPFAGRNEVRLRELSGQNFISFEPDLPTRKAIDLFLRDNRVTVNQSMEFDNIETVKRAVEIEHGISIVPRATVADEVKSGSLAVVELADEGMVRLLGAVRKRTHPKTPAYKEFLKMLTDHQFGIGPPELSSNGAASSSKASKRKAEEPAAA